MISCSKCKKATLPVSEGGCIRTGGIVDVGCEYGEPRIITNADRIRQMTDEELAGLWWERVDCVVCPVHRDCKMTGQDCKQLALSWLKQEVDNGDT